jgi:hypothetical protein
LDSSGGIIALIKFYVAGKDIEGEEFHSSETMVTVAPFVVIVVFLTGPTRGIFLTVREL